MAATDNREWRQDTEYEPMKARRRNGDKNYAYNIYEDTIKHNCA
jgi:hypothetical protein